MLKILKIVCPLLAVIFVGFTLVEQWQQISSQHWTLHSGFLSLSFLLLVLIFFLDALGWWLILSAFNIHVPATTAISIWLQASLTRYLPGVIWSYASRTVLAKEVGVEPKECILTMLVENVMLLLGSFAIGLPAILSAMDVPMSVMALVEVLFVALTIIGLGLSPAAVFSRVPLIKRYFDGVTSTSFLANLKLFAFYSLFWLLFSMVFVIFLRGCGVIFEGLHESLLLGSAFSASFAIGFAMIVFPGGMGIREVTLYGLISAMVGPAMAIALSVASRAWLIIGELVSLAITLILFKAHGFRQS